MGFLTIRVGIPFVKQSTRVRYRLADVHDYERRNVDSLSAWLLGSDRPLPEMEALLRAANLPLQKIRHRIANPPVEGAAPPPPTQPADVCKSPQPEPTESSAYSDWQPLASPEPSSHRSPINAGHMDVVAHACAVTLHQRGLLAGDALHACQGFGLAVAKVVEHGDLVPGIEQLDKSVGADITGAASDKNHDWKVSC